MISDRPTTFENHFRSTLHLLSKMIWSLFSFFRRNSMPAILGSYSRDLNMWGIILKSLSKKGNPNGMTTWISWLKDISLRFSSCFAEPNLICLIFCEILQRAQSHGHQGKMLNDQLYIGIAFNIIKLKGLDCDKRTQWKCFISWL